MILPAALGAILGGVAILTMKRLAMLEERSGLAVLVSAIALFYPVFAFQAEASTAVILLHCSVFLAFVATAGWGFRKGAHILAAALIAHGMFDAITVVTGHPGPIWWPYLCAGLDICAGTLLLWYLQKRRIPA